jgi:hypothetical protein
MTFQVLLSFELFLEICCDIVPSLRKTRLDSSIDRTLCEVSTPTFSGEMSLKTLLHLFLSESDVVPRPSSDFDVEV